MSVRPFGKLLYTKTEERVKIIERGFFYLQGACQESNLRKPNAQRLTKIKPNEIFNDFAMSQDPLDEIDPDFFYFKGMD